MTNGSLRRTDSAERVIVASAQVVYLALLDPKAVTRWLPPEGMTGHVHAFEAKEGGRYRMALVYDKSEHGNRGKTSDETDIVEGRFVELRPNERVVQQVEFESEDPAFAGIMTINWAPETISGGTRVRVTCANVPEGISREDHEAGLSSTLANLAGFTERNPRA
ncbi:ATPase [Ensifer adhaerens]|uniref:SRPBCC domain-containing protein n=1 Tax=Ensifer canadensis TaxID=555315 RepID=UPI00148F79D1|nr:SRPBCC domain-containing protein [Ensifer canadensis]NOV15846.1 ATPase [Ensifer canadensis]